MGDHGDQSHFEGFGKAAQLAWSRDGALVSRGLLGKTPVFFGLALGFG